MCIWIFNKKIIYYIFKQKSKQIMYSNIIPLNRKVKSTLVPVLVYNRYKSLRLLPLFFKKNSIKAYV
jgi:hypothetical protein